MATVSIPITYQVTNATTTHFFNVYKYTDSNCDTFTGDTQPYYTDGISASANGTINHTLTITGVSSGTHYFRVSVNSGVGGCFQLSSCISVTCGATTSSSSSNSQTTSSSTTAACTLTINSISASCT